MIKSKKKNMFSHKSFELFMKNKFKFMRYTGLFNHRKTLCIFISMKVLKNVHLSNCDENNNSIEQTAKPSFPVELIVCFFFTKCTSQFGNEKKTAQNGTTFF